MILLIYNLYVFEGFIFFKKSIYNFYQFNTSIHFLIAFIDFLIKSIRSFILIRQDLLLIQFISVIKSTQFLIKSIMNEINLLY